MTPKKKEEPRSNQTEVLDGVTPVTEVSQDPGLFADDNDFEKEMED
jgi:hypothetical protein